MLIAESLRIAWFRGIADPNKSAAEMHEDCFNLIAEVLQCDNLRFNHDAFYKAVYEGVVDIAQERYKRETSSMLQ